MSIKNSFKILLNRFEIVGEILLFLLVFIVLFCALGAIYVQPVIQAFVDLTQTEDVEMFYSVITNGGLDTLVERVKNLLNGIRSIFIGDKGLIFKTSIVPVLMFITFNLFANMYELPLCKVLEARMSSNAKISLMGNVISMSGKSAIYVLVKLLFTIVFDAIIFLAMWGSYKLLILSSMPLLIPFIELLILLSLMSLKYCFIVTWVQSMVIGEKKIFKAFGESVRNGFGHFWYTFASYFVSWLIVLVVNSLVALLTFGVGLIITIPVSIFYMELLEMTAYYSWNGKRYYLDGHRIVGMEQELTEKLD